MDIEVLKDARFLLEKRNAVSHEICLHAVEEFDLDCCTRFDLKFNLGSGVLKEFHVHFVHYC